MNFAFYESHWNITSLDPGTAALLADRILDTPGWYLDVPDDPKV